MSDSARKHPKGPVPEGVFRELVDRSSELTVAAHKRGVEVSVAFQNGYAFSQDPLEATLSEVGFLEHRFAASHAKLAVGAYTVARLNGSMDGRWFTVDDMLRRSDNDAMRQLCGDQSGEINQETRDLAGVSVDALTIRPDGSYFSGMTTAGDSVRMLVHLLHTAKQRGRPGKRAELHLVADMLSNNTSRYGVRNVIPPGHGIHLLNKTADYYGHRDDEVGEAVHHDTGVMYRKVDGHVRRIVYGITTSAQSKSRAALADRYVGEIGREIAGALGHDIRRPLASRALLLT